MDVFFDTEFSSLDANATLISIGCVSADGREFYAETDSWDEDSCSYFVLETVLPLLQGGAYRMSETVLAARLKVWIESFTGEEVVLRSDAPGIDWPWIEALFAAYECWPRNLRRQCVGVYFEHFPQQQRYLDATDAFWKVNAELQQHHALWDARSILFAYNRATAANLVQAETIKALIEDGRA